MKEVAARKQVQSKVPRRVTLPLRELGFARPGIGTPAEGGDGEVDSPAVIPRVGVDHGKIGAKNGRQQIAEFAIGHEFGGQGPVVGTDGWEQLRVG